MAAVISLVPLSPQAQVFSLDIGSVTYRFRVIYADSPEGGWLLDIRAADDTPIVCGIPLLPKSNLLAQYGYLGFGFGLFLQNVRDPDASAAYGELGGSANLYVLQVA